MKDVGNLIKTNGLPDECKLPLVIGILGSSGRCGKGSIEALDNLHVTYV